ncbi:hypothetical protein EVAR_3282_1 [Eumeta japonica]|uniref:Uncharacterized protein n=1 Tax=Eumeta variegata TaxID=151549 RepID=A0A4C1SVU1_EUMVA|nr:hypothetical protein EVAR_3282_1 [Eumeta japonica]
MLLIAMRTPRVCQRRDCDTRRASKSFRVESAMNTRAGETSEAPAPHFARVRTDRDAYAHFRYNTTHETLPLCLAANDILRRYYAPRTFLLLRRVPILRHCDAFVTNFTAAEFLAL